MIKGKIGDVKLLTGKLFGFYRAVVEDNNDPLRAGRVRARIFGLHTEKKVKDVTEGIPSDELMWIEPCLPIMEGGVSGYGIFSVPLQGSHVMVFFEGGNIMQGRYFASMPGIVSTLPNRTKGFNDPDGVYPERTGVDWENKSATYPHNFVVAVHGGHYVEFDSTPGNERIKVFHKTGTETEVNSDGSVDINIVDNETKQVDGTMTETVAGDVTETYQSNQTLAISVDRTKTVGGDETTEIDGTMDETVDGAVTETYGPWTVSVNGACNITATGNVTITSPATTVTGGTVSLASQETMLKLLNENFADRYDDHQHAYWNKGIDCNCQGRWDITYSVLATDVQQGTSHATDTDDMTANTEAS
jgi:hypothetical protein